MCIFPELREERLALFPDSIGRAFEISPPRRAISGTGGVADGAHDGPKSQTTVRVTECTTYSDKNAAVWEGIRAFFFTS